MLSVALTVSVEEAPLGESDAAPAAHGIVSTPMVRTPTAPTARTPVAAQRRMIPLFKRRVGILPLAAPQDKK
jgi:hypothetical protein